MNAQTFDELLERKLSDSRSVLAGKAEEYSHGGDRLSNFKRAAKMLNCTPEAALLSFVTKHITALYDFVTALPNGSITIEQWSEKTGDIRNYMILLDGLIEERLGVGDKQYRMLACDEKIIVGDGWSDRNGHWVLVDSVSIVKNVPKEYVGFFRRPL